MANGIEDLREKNKGRGAAFSKKFSQWNKFQGKEDAEMLLEKTAAHNFENGSLCDYDAWENAQKSF